MKAEILIPTELSDIWLKTYQEFIKVADNSNDDIFICEKMVQIFCGIHLKEVAQIRWADVQHIVNKVNEAFSQKPKFQKRFKIKGVEFGFIPDLENISFGEYIDLTENIKDLKDMHKAMAVMYRPITESSKDKYEIEPYVSSTNYAEVMKYATIDIALGAKVFFWNLHKKLSKSTLVFLEKEMMTKEMQTILAKEVSLEKLGGGIPQFMLSLKATLSDLEKLQKFPYKTALHGSLLKSKKQILKMVRYNEN